MIDQDILDFFEEDSADKKEFTDGKVSSNIHRTADKISSDLIWIFECHDLKMFLNRVFADEKEVEKLGFKSFNLQSKYFCAMTLLIKECSDLYNGNKDSLKNLDQDDFVIRFTSFLYQSKKIDHRYNNVQQVYSFKKNLMDLIIKEFDLNKQSKHALSVFIENGRMCELVDKAAESSKFTIPFIQGCYKAWVDSNGLANTYQKNTTGLYLQYQELYNIS